MHACGEKLRQAQFDFDKLRWTSASSVGLRLVILTLLIKNPLADFLEGDFFSLN